MHEMSATGVLDGMRALVHGYIDLSGSCFVPLSLGPKAWSAGRLRLAAA